MSHKIISGIYRITQISTGKIYIGQSENIEERWKSYYRIARNPKRLENTHICNALKKYGLDDFKFEILKETYDLDYWEIFLIQIHHSTDINIGFNIQKGGAYRTYYGSNGDATRLKVSESMKASEAFHNAMKLRSKLGWKAILGEDRYALYVERQRKSHLGKKFPKESLIRRSQTVSKPVICTTDGNTFNSTQEAESFYIEKLGVSRLHIVEVCQGIRKSTHGLQFNYI